MRLQVIICLKKELLNFFAFFYKTCANTQQVLPVQTGLYRSDEWMVQDINDKNLNELTELNRNYFSSLTSLNGS